jgi:hypothetical protein
MRVSSAVLIGVLAAATSVSAQVVEITPAASAVTASTSDVNLPGNTVDNDLNTRWSGSGDGAWLQLDLGTNRTVSRVGVAVYQGNLRRNRFDIQYSTGGGVWTNALTNLQSSGTTTAEEAYNFPAPVTARYVRYLGHTATLNAGGTSAWNSVAEVSVFEPSGPTVTPTPTPVPTVTPTPTPSATPTPVPTATPTRTPTPVPSEVEITPAGGAVTASTNDGNTPANTVDGSLATRWSGNGDGAWIQYDLGSTHTIAYVKLAVYNGNSRSNRFDLQVGGTSTGPWTTVIPGGATSGTTTALETHDFADANARYVRYLGHGSTASTFNSLTEVEIWGSACTSCPTPTPTATPSPTHTPTPTPPVSNECAARFDNGGPKSTWVFFNASGTLSYKPMDSRGDVIMDFSHAGYGGGGVALPNVTVVETLNPSGGDDTAAIQAALDRTAARPLSGGFRGAVRLNAGSWKVTSQLRISASGVVLRGAGSGTSGTVINVAATTPYRFMSLAGVSNAATSNTVSITDAYVPSGTRSFNVSSTAGFSVGDAVFVERPITADWVHFMGMDTLVRDGQPQTWLAPGSAPIRTDRTIAAISGNRITLDVPMSDSIDATYLNPPGGTLSKYSWPGRIANVGMEGLRLNAPPQGTSLSGPQYGLVTMDNLIDAWVKDIYMKDCVNCMSSSQNTKRVTLESITIQHTGGVSGAPYPADFSLNGTQTLLHKSKDLAAANVYTVIAQGKVTGPIATLGFVSTGDKAIEPHQRWATGWLIDGADVDGGIHFINRTTAGSGHGWTVGWGVSWNSMASKINLQRPPGTQNWSIGSSGTQSGNGQYESHGTKVSPSSLFLAQLCTRLGPQALTNIGY